MHKCTQQAETLWVYIDVTGHVQYFWGSASLGGLAYLISGPIRVASHFHGLMTSPPLPVSLTEIDAYNECWN